MSNDQDSSKNGFDWLSLDEDEEILWSGQPRIKSIIPAIIIGIVLIPFIIGILIIAGAYLGVKNTDFVVTNKGLYRKKGVLSRKVKKIDFDKVQNISFNQGVLGNYFDYGNIEISTAGSSGVEMKFNSIKNPKNIQERINREISKKAKQGEKSKTTQKSQNEILTEILEEINETKQVLKNIEEKI